MRTPQSFGRLLVLLAAAVGAPVAAWLFDVHVHVRVLDSYTGGMCGDTPDCAVVARSPWAEWLGVPVALLGVGFFAGVLLLVVLSFVRAASEEHARRVLVLFGAAVLVCAVLLAASLSLDALCTGCLVLYLCCSAGALGAWLWAGARSDGLGAALRRRESVELAAMFAAVVLVGLLLGDLRSEELRAREEALKAGTIVPERPELEQPESPWLGSIDAPVKVMVFSDFQCPFCAEYTETYRRLAEEHPKLVRVEFHHFAPPQHGESVNASRASEAAFRQGKFWGLHDLLFAHPEDYSLRSLRRLAEWAGLDLARYDAWMDSQESVAIVERRRAFAAAVGVFRAPTTVVGRRRYDRRPSYEELLGWVEDELALRSGGGD